MEKKVIDSFVGKYQFLSNFYIYPLVYDGTVWKSGEHAYQACKTLDLNEKAWIAAAALPGIAKNRGNNRKLGKNETMRCTLRPNWDNIKNDFMREVVKAKFSDPHMAALLRQTEGAELIEGNWWGDRWFGMCDGKGLNWLGKILMEVRESL